MSWLAIIAWLISNVPEILSLIQSLIQLIEGKGHASAEPLRLALSDLIAKGDVSGVKDAVSNAIPSPSELVQP